MEEEEGYDGRDTREEEEDVDPHDGLASYETGEAEEDHDDDRVKHHVVIHVVEEGEGDSN